MSERKFVLIVQCPDRRGIVAAVAAFLASNHASIEESNHFNHRLSDRFYMRTVFKEDGPMPGLDALGTAFQPIVDRFGMQWQLHDLAYRPQLLIAVSKFDHCLDDLIHRWRSGHLKVDIAAVVSNHSDMRDFVEWHGIPFFHLPIMPGQKEAQEARLLELVEEYQVDLTVLARYMQILSSDLVAQLSERCINIHHSFLPSFKGAKPYHQAHARGVKLIGATAHYVTHDLDEGPIIEQGVRRVRHSHGPEDLVVIGREIESSVLARAVQWHIEHRVIVTDGKTIVFE